MQPMRALTVPFLSDNLQTAIYAQVRPVRKSGVRLEIEFVQVKGQTSKLICHNYGHGGAGVSLAYGCAERVVQLYAEHCQDNPSNALNAIFAVIGCGIIGLTTALTLRQRYPDSSITIYSSNMPNMNSLDNSELITSEVAPGYWLRYGYGGEQCEVLYRRSYAILSGMIEKSHYKALGYSEVYYCGEGYSEEKMREQLVDEQLGTLKSGWMLVNGAKMVFKQFRTIKVDMRRFLAELVEDCVRRRIKIEQKEFGSRKEVENVEQRVVFNCAGYGGGRLFQDNQMVGVRGHLIQYRNVRTKEWNYILKMQTEQGEITVYCHRDRVLLGATFEEGCVEVRVNQECVQELKKRYWMMLQDIEKRKEESKHGDVDGEGKGKGGEEKQKRDRKDLVGLEGKAVKEVQTQPRAKL